MVFLLGNGWVDGGGVVIWAQSDPDGPTTGGDPIKIQCVSREFPGLAIHLRSRKSKASPGFSLSGIASHVPLETGNRMVDPVGWRALE